MTRTPIEEFIEARLNEELEPRALRAIVAMHVYEDWPDEDGPGNCRFCYREENADDTDGYLWPCPHVRIVASRWSNHPDYDQGWAL